jgi:hypothetical protein
MDQHNSWLTLRDYFAANCPDSWLENVRPPKISEMNEAMISRGILPTSSLHYDKSHERQFDAMLRYEYADEMLKARSK